MDFEPCPDCGAAKEKRELPYLGGIMKEFWLYPCGCAEKRDQEESAKRAADDALEAIQSNTRRVERQYREAGILRGMMGHTFERWDARPELADSVAVVKKYADKLPQYVAEGRGLLLTGEPGTGKTHLATAIIHRAIEGGIDAQIVNSTELLRSLRPAAANPEETEERYRTIALLVIDDLGKEKYSAWVEEVLYHIINFRLNDCRATVITTNFSSAELEQRIGQATVDRIAQLCQPVIFKAKSLRLAKARHLTGGQP